MKPELFLSLKLIFPTYSKLANSHGVVWALRKITQNAKNSKNRNKKIVTNSE